MIPITMTILSQHNNIAACHTVRCLLWVSLSARQCSSVRSTLFFSDINILQRSVATYSRLGSIFGDHFIANLLISESVTVKEL